VVDDTTWLDAIIDAAGSEMNEAKRAQLIADAQRCTQSRHYVLPIHRQMITWAARSHVTTVVMPDNAVRAHWVKMQ
jgi:peptide/nickel transport system substrate-binding protein